MTRTNAPETRTRDETRLVHMGQSCACFNLRKAARTVTQLYDQALRSTGLRATQLTLLAAIKLLGPVTMKRLAEVAVMDRTTLTRNLKPLSREGLISVTPGDDLRVRKTTLTAKGERELAKALPLWEKAQARVIDGLGKTRFEALLAGLSELIALR